MAQFLVDSYKKLAKARSASMLPTPRSAASNCSTTGAAVPADKKPSRHQLPDSFKHLPTTQSLRPKK